MKLIMNTRAAVAILMATAMIFSSILLEPLLASAAVSVPGGTDASVWTTDFSLGRSVSFKKLPAIVDGGPRQEFSSPDTLPSNHLLWSDLGNLGKLEFTLKLPSNITSWSARLNPVGSTCSSLTYGGNYSDASPDVPYFFDINLNCAEDQIPSIFQFELTTFVASVEDSEIGVSTDDFVYLVRKPDSQTFVLKYENPGEITANFLPDDSRWMQVVDSSSELSQAAEPPLLPVDVRGVRLIDPSFFWGSQQNNKYFGGWCTVEGLAGRDMDHCYFPGELFPVYRDTVLYPLWVNDLDPTSISFTSYEPNGGPRTSPYKQTFSAETLRRAPGKRTFYLTVDYLDSRPRIGAVSIGGQRGLDFNVQNIKVRLLDSPSNISPEVNGEYKFIPSCTDSPCSEVFVLNGSISAGGKALMENYTIYLIVATDLAAEFDVNFDATPGNRSSVTGETIAPVKKTVDWYEVPAQQFTHTGYTNEASWIDTITNRENGWKTWFPVLGQETLSLDWYSTPSVYAPTNATIYRGDSQVVTATSDQYDLPVTWGLTGNTHFYVSQSGVITADPLLAVGSYTFFIEAKDRWMAADEAFQMTVTVVERSQVDSSQNSGSSTNQTGAGQDLPKPGSKLQADLISKVSRSKLAVGGTAQFGVTGGEPGATRVFASSNPRICSINARGLVTAKSTGVCLISATATAMDPVFATASAPLTKIAVLGSGLINNAKVTELKGQVSIKASLLKSLAGKSVKLAIEVKRGGKLVLVPMRSEVLSKSATATFKSLAKPRPGTRVVLTVGGRAVYALTL